jgi:hypothetical protein
MCTDTATEIINFAAAQAALVMIDAMNVNPADRDEVTRNVIAYGPAVTNR